MAIIDFNKTVYDLCSENEKVAEILAEIGFKDITRHGMLNTAGRFMTIPKGAKGKNFDLEEIKKEFIKRDFEIKE